MMDKREDQVRVPSREAGFTLIELVIVVLIVAILTAIALPNFRAQMQRGKIPEATTGLASARTAMEQWFQDNRAYNTAGNPCATPAQWNTKNFTFACVLADSTHYTITASGVATGIMNGFTFTVDQANAKTSTITPWGVPASACWIAKKGDTC